MNGYTLNDFFCGCGGMGLGFKNAGFRITGAWDYDKYTVKSYRHNVGDHIQQADISQMTYLDVPLADVWTFGFPCQDISVAGKKAGMVKGETRSGLFYEIMRLLDETLENLGESYLPKIIMAENVKMLKKYLPTLEEEYAAHGYKMYATLFNSKYWGVPQNRERYFVVGVRDDIDAEFVFPTQQTEFVPKLSSILESNVDERYYISDEKAAKIIEQAMRRTVTEPDINDTDSIGGIWGDRQAGRAWNKNGVSPTLKTPSGGYSEPLILDDPKIIRVGNTHPSGRGMNGFVYSTDGLSPTVTTNKGEGHKIADGYRVRKLSPREYARLQGFPEDFEIVVSNTQAYKQFWNAVTVNVSEAIAKQIAKFLDVNVS